MQCKIWWWPDSCWPAARTGRVPVEDRKWKNLHTHSIYTVKHCKSADCMLFDWSQPTWNLKTGWSTQIKYKTHTLYACIPKTTLLVLSKHIFHKLRSDHTQDDRKMMLCMYIYTFQTWYDTYKTHTRYTTWHKTRAFITLHFKFYSIFFASHKSINY